MAGYVTAEWSALHGGASLSYRSPAAMEGRGMANDDEVAGSAAVDAVRGFLGGPHRDGEGWSFEFGEHLESNWGAVYGGALAAGMLSVARSVAPDRSPRSLHIQIVRSVPRGPAFVTADVRHAGRTVATIEVNLYDARRKLSAIALVTMVTPDAIAADLHDTTASPPFQVVLREQPQEYTDLGNAAPVITTLDLLATRDGVPVMLTADNVRTNVDGTEAFIGDCTVPWERLDQTGPEAACLAADARIGAGIMRSSVPLEVIGPNADLSLRFTTAPATRVVRTASVVLSIQHGTATVGLELQAGDQLLAHGLATGLLLPPKS
jgi:acyl-coenzyme A thioesterase PaaI-like protein